MPRYTRQFAFGWAVRNGRCESLLILAERDRVEPEGSGNLHGENTAAWPPDGDSESVGMRAGGEFQRDGVPGSGAHGRIGCGVHATWAVGIGHAQARTAVRGDVATAHVSRAKRVGLIGGRGNDLVDRLERIVPGLRENRRAGSARLRRRNVGAIDEDV